jgi:tetratricopeptide (TPR) repeat protein
MTEDAVKFRLELIGSFQLFAPDGARITIPAKRSRVLLAMLATARSGERSRQWLQDRIWGSRDRAQAQASLRRELSNLRPIVNIAETPLLLADHDILALNLPAVEVDVRDTSRLASSRGEFLEGIDMACEEGFDDWLREERQAIYTDREAAQAFGGLGIAIDLPEAPAAMRGRPTLSVIVQHHDLPVDEAAVLEGIADNLAERIARLRWLPLVGAPAGTLRIDSPETLKRVGQLLGADYLLHCRLGQRRTFALALSQASNGHLLWSSRYALGEPVAASEVEQIATDAVAALSLQIETDQQLRVRDRGIHHLSADELIWRARWHMRRLTREDSQIADSLLEIAAKTRPGSAEVMIERGYAEAWKLWNQGAPTATIEELRRRIVIARDVDPYDARAWLLLGILDMWTSRHDSAVLLMREAIRLNPSLSFAYGHLGSCHSLMGRPEEGIVLIRTALRLNPLEMQNFHQYGELALANFMSNDLDGAVAEADAALARRPGYIHAHALKIAALWLAGDVSRGHAAVIALRRIRPNYDPIALEWLPFKDRSWNKRLRQVVSTALNHDRITTV